MEGGGRSHTSCPQGLILQVFPEHAAWIKAFPEGRGLRGCGFGAHASLYPYCHCGMGEREGTQLGLEELNLPLHLWVCLRSHRETAAIYAELKHFSEQKKGKLFHSLVLG